MLPIFSLIKHRQDCVGKPLGKSARTDFRVFRVFDLNEGENGKRGKGGSIIFANLMTREVYNELLSL